MLSQLRGQPIVFSVFLNLVLNTDRFFLSVSRILLGSGAETSLSRAHAGTLSRGDGKPDRFLHARPGESAGKKSGNQGANVMSNTFAR